MANERDDSDEAEQALREHGDGYEEEGEGEGQEARGDGQDGRAGPPESPARGQETMRSVRSRFQVFYNGEREKESVRCCCSIERGRG